MPKPTKGKITTPDAGKAMSQCEKSAQQNLVGCQAERKSSVSSRRSGIRSLFSTLGPTAGFVGALFAIGAGRDFIYLLVSINAELGPYMASGRLQRSPMPAKGGIFDRTWWQPYESPDGKFPRFSHVVASLDSAFTEKEQNDPSGLTIWGVFQTPEKRRRIMLVYAWRKHRLPRPAH